MLKLLRKKKVTKRIYYVLAVLIIPAFVIWGSASVINREKTPNHAGVFFGKKVGFDEFRDALYAWKIQLKIQFGEKAEEIAAAFFNPTEAAWDRLILLHEARQRKIKVADKEVVAAITRMPFLERDGRFDPETYEVFLKYALGIPARAFEENVRQNLALAEVFEQVTATAAVSEGEIRKAYAAQNEQVRIQYVFFPNNAEKEKIAVPEDEVRAYYENSREKFKIPPQIDASYAGIEFKEDAAESEKDAAARRLKDVRVQAGREGFEKAAAEAKLEIKGTGLFGFEDPVPGFGWLPQLSTLLFGLEPGSLSQVVALKRGAYIFKIKEKKDAAIPDFKEAEAKAKEALIDEKAKELNRAKAGKFVSEARSGSLSLAEAAKTAGLVVKETPLFSREAYIPEIGMAPELKDAAFRLAPDEVAADAIELKQGFYVIGVREKVPFDEEKFKKDKEEFAAHLLEQERNKVFNEFFEDLKRRAGLVTYVGEKDVK